MTQAAYARHRGVTSSYISESITKGKIIIDQNSKMVNKEASDVIFGPVNKFKNKTKRVSSTDESHAGALVRAKVEKEKQSARMAKLKADKLAGLLIEKKGVEDLWAKVIVNVKTMLLAVPSKVKGRVPRLTTEEILIFEEEIRFALEGLDTQDTGEPEVDFDDFEDEDLEESEPDESA